MGRKRPLHLSVMCSSGMQNIYREFPLFVQLTTPRPVGTLRIHSYSVLLLLLVRIVSQTTSFVNNRNPHHIAHTLSCTFTSCGRNSCSHHHNISHLYTSFCSRQVNGFIANLFCGIIWERFDWVYPTINLHPSQGFLIRRNTSNQCFRSKLRYHSCCRT